MRWIPRLSAILFLSIDIGNISAHAAPVDSFQSDIDWAVQEIMTTRVGQAICQKIIGAQASSIEYHLGVSPEVAASIAQNCQGDVDVKWISQTSSQNISKLNLGRKYSVLSAETEFPIESWTDPFTNTTVLMAGPEGLTHERLVQLLAHEMAVYFDGKVNPAHTDAQNIPEIKALELETASKINPLVAVTDPLVAHTLTFVRALQVEYAIVDELIAAHKIVPPSDHEDAYLKYLISDQCREDCLELLVTNMRLNYLPIGLPLLAFAPHFRAMVAKEVAKAKPLWRQTQWIRFQDAVNNLPVEFLKGQSVDNPLRDLQRVFALNGPPTPEFAIVAQFLSEQLWPLEQSAIEQTRLSTGETLLEFMKVPLLSGSNILLSSGPRVRVKPGNVE